MKKIAFLLFISLFSISPLVYADNAVDKEKAHEHALEAVRIMANGFIEEGLELLKESAKLDPGNCIYPYEIAYAHVMNDDLESAKDILEELVTHEDRNDLVYQLLGNCYDWLGDKGKARATYDDGLRAFPNSGPLYLEKSIMYLDNEDYNSALEALEKGVAVDPMYPSNYYWLAKLFLESSEEKVWGMIYGELFVNLEPGSERTYEMSQLLYDTYVGQIKINKNSISANFSKPGVISLNTKDLRSTSESRRKIGQSLSSIKLSYGQRVYESSLLQALKGESKVDMHSLNRARSKFLDSYYEKEYNKVYPNVLFDFQKSVKDAGHLEAYNYWVLMEGSEDFDDWLERAENKEKFEGFVYWIEDHLLEITNYNVFLRSQYN